ncbi:helix-turn-helix domain-containing protein [Pedobacter fastidiosus]|uniref:Helix-turn-helix transcriptional regulator n=1 Tax=Pedobacter fastidiosus TaxID=2765361 RepID=A0ABR7KPC1_9SPHI|nr:helix-turn-helix transcriptional regulator [Pedobacter fastidiosus]MBC6109946.1 helix-turn-helix transcriptional regulator [Pedobacter fastidiosus]
MVASIDDYVIAKVKEFRLTKGYSQSYIANELNVSVGFIGMVESSKYSNHYNLKHLNKLAEVLECSPKDFLPDNPIL